MLLHDPFWYKDAIIYEVHVRAFHDHLGDGRGDFRGLTQKLDYLQDLGVTAIWLLPFYPSPLKDDGYDIADYTNIHPHYGTLADFDEFLHEAHRRGLRVITELVVNHTSDQHAWFQRARRSPPGSPERDFYVWSDTPDRYTDARIIFKDFESSNWAYDPVAKAYYWHRFYSHQPDLNFDNPAVWQALIPVVDFWLQKGVDGMRLDAVPYLFEREGTNCENLPETHEFLRVLRRHVDERFPERMLLAEANQWPEDAIAYFGQGDECHMAFHFPVMPRLFMAIHQEDRFPIIDILAQTPAIPENCQWALFLRNHDELTLEMVTDEERDYMYRAYASEPQARINLGIRRRLAPLLGNDRRRIELMNALLFSLPGTPVIYYGDEIGMGDNIYLGDRNGVRTPMQWSADRNAGFSRANPQRLYLPIIIDPEYHYEAIHVESLQNNPHSLLWWMKRLIALRKSYKAFGRGSLTFINADNPKVLVFLRHYQEEHILVVANLSRFVQFVELHLSDFQGSVPVELFGQVEFPRIGSQPYFLSLGPHAFYWFTLVPHRVVTLNGEVVDDQARWPVLTPSGGWDSLVTGRGKKALEDVLPGFLQGRRWFARRDRPIKSARILEAVRVPHGDAVSYVTLLRVEHVQGEVEIYVLPLTAAWGAAAEQVLNNLPHVVIARLQGETAGVLYDAVWEPSFGAALLEAIRSGMALPGSHGVIQGAVNPSSPSPAESGAAGQAAAQTHGERSHTAITYQDRLILKLFRRVEEGVNPDVEIRRFLTERCQFPHTAPVVGSLEYRRPRSQPMTLAIQQTYLANEGTAWQHTLDVLGRFFERALASPNRPPQVALHPAAFLEHLDREPPPLALDLIDNYLESARLLGQRSGELHRALASETEDPNFSAEPFSMLYQRSIYQSMRAQVGTVFLLLDQRLPRLCDLDRERAERLLQRRGELLSCFKALADHKIPALRIRCHGDYHLAQVLFTGKDFLLTDFEGDPGRPLSERRLKRSPLRDVVAMLRSFHYAVYTALAGASGGPPLGISRAERLAGLNVAEAGGPPTHGMIRPADVAVLEPWGHFWYQWVGATFLKGYFAATGETFLFPPARDDLRTLFQAFLLERAVYELGYELNQQRDQVAIPLLALLQMLEPAPETQQAAL